MSACWSSAIREELNRTSQRRMGVLRPLKVVIENYPEGQTEELEAINHPDDPSAGTRKITFGRELYIEQRRLHGEPAEEVLPPVAGQRGAAALRLFRQVHRCDQERSGRVVELRCTYDPATKGGNAARRPQGQGDHALAAGGDVGAGGDPHLQPVVLPIRARTPSNFAADLNPQSLEILSNARIEASVAESNSTEPMQFERQGYFVRDKDSDAGQAGVFADDRPARDLREGSRQGLRSVIGGSYEAVSRCDRFRLIAK